jgi:hypothetical protein
MTTATKTTRKVRSPKRNNKTIIEPGAKPTYSGEPITATRVYRRSMVEFTNTEAVCWLLIDDASELVTYAATYDGLLKASYRPAHYTYALKPKVIEKKLAEYEEVPVKQWPTWIKQVKTRKSK